MSVYIYIYNIKIYGIFNAIGLLGVCVMAVGDLYQCVVTASLLGVNVNNIYWYQQVAGSAANSAELLGDGLLGGVTEIVRDMQHQDYNTDELRVVNWNTPTDFHNRTNIVQPGTVNIGEPLPTFAQYSFTFAQPYPGVKSGGKRFAGVAEAYTNGNTGGVPQALWEATAEALGNVLNVSGLSFKPVVLRSRVNGQPVNTEMGNPPFVTWDVGTVLYAGISTQRSRLRL